MKQPDSFEKKKLGRSDQSLMPAFKHRHFEEHWIFSVHKEIQVLDRKSAHYWEGGCVCVCVCVCVSGDSWRDKKGVKRRERRSETVGGKV